MATLTVSGNEITDAVRLANTQGDGRAYPDSSFVLDPSTTNMCKQGGFEGAITFWGGVSGGAIARIISDFKFGTACLQITADGSNAAGARTDTSNGGAIVIVAGRAYTASAWLKAPAGSSIKVSITTGNNSATGLDSVNTVAVATGAWQRVILTLSAAAVGAIRASISVGFSGIAPPAGTICLVDGVQLENRTYATPYVETNVSTATRGTTSVAFPAPVLDKTQSWAAICIKTGDSAPNGILDTYELYFLGTDQNQANGAIYFNGRDIGAGQVLFSVSRNGTTATTRTVVGIGANQTIIIIVTWTATTLRLSVNGSAFTSGNVAASGTAPNIERFGNFRGDQGNCAIYWAIGGLGTLTVGDVATLNALSTNDPTLNTLPATATTVFAWGANTSNYQKVNRVQIVVPVTVATTKGRSKTTKNAVVLPLMENIGLVKRVFFNPNKFIVSIQLQSPTHTKKVIKAARTIPLNLGTSSHKKRFHTATVALTLAVGSQSIKRYNGLKRAMRSIPGLDRVNKDL